MNFINQNISQNSASTHNKLSFSSQSWIRGLKCASLFYQWELVKNYESVFKLLKMYQHWSSQERHQVNDLLLKRLIDIWPFTDRTIRIWSCMHIGPYGIIARVLIVLGFKVAVLLRSDVYEEQVAIYRKQFKLSFGKDATESELLFIRSDVGNPLLRLKDAICKGFQIVIFIDGQLSKNEHGKGWGKVNLYNSDINLREGIIGLSYWTQIPITSLFLTIVGEEIKLRYVQDIAVKEKLDYQSVLENIFEPIHRLKIEELIQWEFLPIIFDHTTIKQGYKNIGSSLWLPLYMQNKEMLFDITTGRSVWVAQNEFKIISGKFREFFK
ncbi:MULTISPECIES: hypothetical protein [Sphingobacterium]|uniref:hypothetical protein n=1 Tax=Sphingobacterium TaxID=28453 RepID=UPI00257C9272|nr:MULTISPECIES: hypothetical protein [Sphingobacterium]